MPFDLASAKPVQSGGFDLKSAKPVEQDDYEPLYQKYVKEYNDTKNQVPIPGTPPVDQGPLLSKEDWKKRNDTRFGKNIAGTVVGGIEQAANLAGGYLGYIPALAIAGMQTLNEATSPNPDVHPHFEQNLARWVGHYGSLGSQLVDATGFESGSREAISQGVGNTMNRVGVPMMGLNLPHFNKNAALREAMPELGQIREIPKNSVLTSLDKEVSKPVEDVPKPAFDLNTAKPMSPSQLKEWADLQEKYAQYKRGELPEQKQAAAQAAIDARQQALEQDVARRGSLDFNAAERARQEAAPTGYADWVEKQRQEANTRLPGDNTPMDLGPSTLRSAKNYPDVNDFPNLLQEKPYQYEGGIDYTAQRDRAALPVEIADILRTGDKVPDPFSRVSYGQNAKRMAQPLEDHIAALNRSEAQPESLTRWEGEGGKRGQRGGIDFEILSKEFRNFIDRWHQAGGNFSHVGISRMLDDYPIKLTNDQRNLLSILYPDVAKQYQDRIDRAWAQNDAAKAARYGKRFDDALIAEAIIKHYDAFGKGFKLDGEIYGSRASAARDITNSTINRAKKNQRGAIDVKAIQDAYRKMKDGEGSLFDYLRSFKGTFDESYSHEMAIKSALQDTMDPMSRSRIVFMSPDDFHKLALNRDKSSFAKNSIGEEKRVSIREGLASDEGLISVPMLKVDSGKIIGHEGRHRMDVFKENGVEQVPVIVRDTMHRNENGPLPYRHLISENGMRTIPMDRFTDLNPIQKAPKALNRQSGKIDFKGIQEEGRKVGKFLSEFGTKVVDVLTPAERVAINAIGDSSYIPKGNAPAKIIEAALKDSDANVRFPNLQSGLHQAGTKFKSALMTETARWVSWAEKVGNKEFRERVKPIERSFATLSRDDLVTAHGILQREMFNRRQYTPEELMAHGASEKVIKAYQQLRTEFDNVFNAQNEGRAKLGLDPISKQGAYLASSWSGNYHMPVYDKNGALKWYIKTETRSEANKAMAWLKKNMPDADVSKMKIEYKPENVGANLPRDIGSTIQVMMTIFKDTPLEAEMKAMLEQHMTEAAFNERQHSLHFENKANVRGFLGDRPWLSEHDNARMGIEAQVRYLREAYRWGPMQEAMANIKEVLSDPQLIEKQPNNVAFTKLYVANAMGVTKNIMRGLESYVAQGLGVSPSTMGKFVGDLKNLTYLQLLGLSGGYAVATPLQALLLGPSRHGLISQSGVKHNVLKTMVNSMLDMGLLMGTHEAYNLTGKDFRSKLSPVGREALRYMEDNGIINMTLFDEYAALGEHKGWGLLKNTVGATISLPEKVARTATFMSFVHHLHDGGMPLGNELFRLADEHTQSTLTNFNRSARPLLVDKFGMTGELMYTFKSPLFNTYNNLFEFANHAKRTGDVKPFVTALIMMGTLGGAMSLPMMEEMDGGVELLKSFIAKHKPEWYTKVRDFSVKEAMLKNLPDWATYGTVSNAMNVQMQSRFSNQVMDPNNPMGNVAPIIQEAKEWTALGGAALNPNLTNMQEGIWQNMPPAVKGNMEVGLDNFKSVKKGDKQGYYNPNKLGEREAYVDRSPADERARRFGVTSLEEARQRDVRYINRREDKRLNDVRDAAMDKMFDAVIRGDKKDIQKYGLAYFENYGDSDSFQKDLDKKITHMGLTPEQRKVIYAKTLADAMSIKQSLDMKQRFK